MTRPKNDRCPVCGRRPHGRGIRHLPSGKFQARLSTPGGGSVGKTFETSRDAEAWLTQQRADISRGEWEPAKATTTISLSEYADRWLAGRKVKGRPLADRTRQNYRGLLDRHIVDEFGNVPLHRLEREDIERWYDRLRETTPATASHAYSLLRAVLATAVEDGFRSDNPARVRGAGRVESNRHRNDVLTKTELDAIVDEMPARYRLLIQLGFYCGLRFGELSELRRSDVDTRDGVMHVRRAVVWVKEKGSKAGPVVKSTKNGEERDVAIPPHLLGDVRSHLLQHTSEGPDGLLFSAVHDSEMQVHNSTIRRSFTPARAKAGRPDVRLHDLRHASASRAFEAGATVPQVMHRHGWKSLQMVTRYAHSSREQDRELAKRLSTLDERVDDDSRDGIGR